MNRVFASLAAYTRKWIIQLVLATCRVRWYGNEYFPALLQSHQPWISSTRHDNLVIAACSARKQPLAISAEETLGNSALGRLVALFGTRPVPRASPGKAAGDPGDVRAGLLGLLNEGSNVILSTGNTGDEDERLSWTMNLATEADCPVLCFHFESRRRWKMKIGKSRFRLPLPFSKLYLCIAEPWWVDAERLRTDEAAVVSGFRQRMEDNRQRARRLAGRIRN